MALLQEIKVPLLSVNDTMLTVAELGFENGSRVTKGSIVMVFETSKTTFDVEAEADGFIQYHCEAGKDYEVNHIVGTIYSDAAELVLPVANVPAPQKNQHPAREIPKKSGWQGEPLVSAAARELMLLKNIETAAFNGLDFISTADVEELLGIKKTATLPAKLQEPVAKAILAPPMDPHLVTMQKLSSNKKREISFLSEVQTSGLTSTINTFVEVEGLFRNLNKGLKYLKDSILPLIVYETARLLKKYPLLNAYFTQEGIAVYKEVNIGFAIDIDKGLKVLRIPEQSTETIARIEQQIMDLSGLYLDDAIGIKDLTGITFTITDLSAFGVSFFRPLVNMQNSAIMGISAIDEKLQRCTITITFDHRVTEGKVVALFLRELKERIESYCSDKAAGIVEKISCFKCYKTLQEDLSDTGFARVVTPEGYDDYICQSCLKGF